MIIVVSGPPCAGKNHYVEQHRQLGDVVLDRDVLGGRAYEAALRGLQHGVRSPTWVIACLPGERKRAAFVADLRADRHVHLVPDTNVLMARARSRPHAAREVSAVRAWLQREQDDVTTHARGHGDPVPTPSQWW